MKPISGIILCEGETDQVLLSAYLGRMRGWQHFHNKKSPFPEKSVAWYKKKNGEVLGIWQVGGNCFTEAIKTILARELLEPSIARIAVVTDHDDDSAEGSRLVDVSRAVQQMLYHDNLSCEMHTNSWCAFPFEGSFGRNQVEVGYVLVPSNEIGALETFMLNALSEQSPEKDEVVRQSRDYIRGFESQVYLTRRRERVKAELGVALAAFSPDRVFTTMRELIDSIDWAAFDTTHEQFELLLQI